MPTYTSNYNLPKPEANDNVTRQAQVNLINAIDQNIGGDLIAHKADNMHKKVSNVIQTGNYANAEGLDTIASGICSHAEGSGSVAKSNYSHAEGHNSLAYYGNSFKAIGFETSSEITFESAAALSVGDHICFTTTTSLGYGEININSINGNVAIVSDIIPGSAYNLTCEIEDTGYVWVARISTPSSLSPSHAEGERSIALGYSSHAEGRYSNAIGYCSHSEGSYSNAIGYCSHAEGESTTASGDYSHAEGLGSKSLSSCAHSEGKSTLAYTGIKYFITGFNDTNKTITLTTVSGGLNVNDLLQIISTGEDILFRDIPITAINGLVVTLNTTETINSSWFKALKLFPGNGAPHAEGGYSIASGDSTHAEGYHAVASGDYSHAEGGLTTARGLYSHAEGNNTTASGNGSHSGGVGTIAEGEYQTVIGKYNVSDTSSLFIIGKGSGSSDRVNALAVDTSGNLTVAGSITSNSKSVQVCNAIASSATTGTVNENFNAYSSVITITPTGDCTFNASGGYAGQRVTYIINTSGTTSRTLTWGTNFKTNGTLATGTTTGKTFAVDFVCKDGTTWVETGRTPAM